jgi:hypothetical protein
VVLQAQLLLTFLLLLPLCPEACPGVSTGGVAAGDQGWLVVSPSTASPRFDDATPLSNQLLYIQTGLCLIRA